MSTGLNFKEQAAAPETPPSSYVVLYAKSDGLLYFKKDDGTEVPVVVTDLSALNNIQTGTSYTIQASDNGKNIIFTNASAIAVTLPDTLNTDFHCTIIQVGAGVPTVTPVTDTINGAGTGVAPSAQWKGMYLNQYQDTEWMALL